MRSSVIALSFLLVLSAACQRTDRGTSAPTASTSISVSSAPDASLRETRWVLRRIASQPIGDTASSYQPFLRITEAGTAEGKGGCNTFRAALQPAVNDGELQLAPLQTTRMACPALSTEHIFTQALQNTRAYRIHGDTLWLYGNPERTGTALARLEAMR